MKMIKPYYKEKDIELYNLNILDGIPLPDNHVDCIITSPPYWGLRDYGEEGQIGLEPTLNDYLEHMLFVTAECKRILKPTGVMFWNHGDCYGTGSGAGSREGTKQATNKGSNYYEDTGKKAVRGYEKCMMLQNYRLLIQMIDSQGWILRNDIKWVKPNSMPSSVKDRFANGYEPVFMLVKSQKYWFDLDAVRKPYTEPMNRWGGDNLKANGQSDWDKGTGQATYRDRNMRPNPAGKNPGDVWTIPTQPFPESHFATFPEKLVETPIKAGCPKEICKKCGKARERITETKYIKDSNRFVNKKDSMSCPAGLNQDSSGHNEIKTIGWTDCGCGKGFRHGIVCDIFHGSGTTGKVARKLGRKYIGIDIKKEYMDMSLKTRLKDRYFNL